MDEDRGAGHVQELRRGTVVLACLATLSEPNYGYGLLETLSEAGFSVDGNTLYPLLRRLEKHGLLTSEWNTDESRPRKFYRVSPAGAAMVDTLMTEWTTLDTAIRALGGEDNAMTTTLTDRYVWTVTRHLPADTGPDVARELRGTIDETVEGRIAAGQDPQSAERETLQDLGDPDVLARKYGGRPGYLISPALYPEYMRLLKTLLVILLPLALVGVLLARVTTGDQTWIDIVIEVVLTVLSVGVHIAFWTTLTFAIIDRTRPESQRDRPLTRWDPDQLPSESPRRRVGLGDTLVEVALSVALAALVAWQFGGVGERSAQILNPDLALGWQLAIVALFVLDAVIAIAAWVMGRWTPALAAVTVAANVGSGILLLWLLAEGRLLADLAAVNDRLGWAVDQSAVTAVIGGAVVIVAVWESVDALIKARRGHRGRLAG